MFGCKTLLSLVQNIASFEAKHCFFCSMRPALAGSRSGCMFLQDAMGQVAVSQQLDGAVEVLLQPLACDACVGVVVQCFVDAGDGFYLLEHGADVVADEDDGAVAVDF